MLYLHTAGQHEQNNGCNSNFISLRGTLDFLVAQPPEVMGTLHGYGIARQMEKLSKGRIMLRKRITHAFLARFSNAVRSHGLEDFPNKTAKPVLHYGAG